MKRELNFRFWHKETAKFYYLHLSEIIGLTRTIEIPKESIIEQYAGIVDDFEIPIYEGDVLDITFRRCGRHTCELKWDIISFEFYMLSDDKSFPMAIKDFPNKIKVIGNIHEGYKTDEL